MRLASRLRVPRAQAAGHLTFLWLWTLDYAPTGDLSAFGPAELSAAADFGGDAELFAQALRETGWLDEDNRVHDWMEYAGRLLEEREQAKERMRALRQRQREEKDREREKALRERSAPLRERSEQPYSTQPDRTEPEPAPNSPPRSDTPRANAARRKPAGESEAVECGAMLGLSEEDSKAWWKDMEATGWAKVDGTPFGNWRREMSIHRDRLRERNAGLGPSIQRPGLTDGTPASPSAFTLKTQLEALEREIKVVRNRGHEDALGWEPRDEEDRKRFNELLRKRKAVNAKLAGVT